eukprot:4259859-Amphidinium_carterae.1
MTQAEALLKLRRFMALLGLPSADTSLYVLRHGGASDDWLMQRKNRESIMRHGRWHSLRTVARYEKSSVLLKEIHALPDQ